MSYDPKCHELAEHFLAHDADEAARVALAGAIQDAIEDHLESESRRAGFKSDLLYRMATAQPTPEVAAILSDGLPYPWCSLHERCRVKGYCQRDPNCGE